MPHFFISYRRDDSKAIAGRINDSLVEAFGKNNVFKDVVVIPLGSNFQEVLRKELNHCDFMLVIIGEHWLNSTDKVGHQRLADPKDFVRYEVETALRRSEVKVIPVLIDNTVMPQKDSLPAKMRGLCDRQAARVRHDPDYHHDMQRLIREIKRQSKWRRLIIPAILLLVLIIVATGLFSLFNRGTQAAISTSTDSIVFQVTNNSSEIPSQPSNTLPSLSPTDKPTFTNTVTLSPTTDPTAIEVWTQTSTVTPSLTITETPTISTSINTPTPTRAAIRLAPVSASIESPVSLGDTLVIVESETQQYSVRIDEAYRGEEAWQRLREANQFNERPSTGTEFLLAHVTIHYLKGTIPSKLIVHSGNFGTYSSGYFISLPEAAVPPDPQFIYAEMRPTDTEEGWIVLQIYNGEQKPLITFGDSSDIALMDTFGPSGDIIYFAAYGNNNTHNTYNIEIQPSYRVKPNGY